MIKKAGLPKSVTFSRHRAQHFFSALALLCLALLFPGAPWSPFIIHHLDRLKARAGMTLAKWRGCGPASLSLRGRAGIPGAKIEALNSSSGWATLSDARGEFLLPGLLWYPGASYELLIHTDGGEAALVKLDAPRDFPEGGIVDVGGLDLSQSSIQRGVEPGELYGITSVSYIDYDAENAGYYREVFERLTEGLAGDEEKLEAVNTFVATKLNYDETAFTYDSPREIMEKGSRYCGNLSLAMATLLRAGGYKSRVLDLSDAAAPPNTHVLVEVNLGGAWRLYDPTFGLIFRNEDGTVCTYRDLRLKPRLLTGALARTAPRESRRRLLSRLPGIYESGFHHFYQFRR
ncbi:MAG TPA: transglutaminase domain-containing protein [Blastocatellia bacterium]|nr:transglutaminase domain-containing protein [Blastocatellia bacterium]